MKKFFSILTTLAVLAAFTVLAAPCLAESKAGFEKDGVKLDNVPEGYTVELEKDDNGIRYLTLSPDVSTKPVMFISITNLDEELAYLAELNADMTDEELSEYADYFIEDYYDPSINIAETEHGTPLLVIDENGEDGDNGEVIGFHNGCIVDLAIVSLKDEPLNQDDFNLAFKVISDLWFE